MFHGESESDAEIRRALRRVEAPAGAKEKLLQHLLREAEKLLPPNASVEVSPGLLSAQHDRTKEEPGELLSSSSPLVGIPKGWDRRRAFWGMLAVVASLLLAGFVLRPNAQTSRIDVLLARQIDFFEDQSIMWSADMEIPHPIRTLLQQVVELQPLGQAEVERSGTLYPMHVYAFRNQDGKQVLVIDMPKPNVKPKFGALLTPLNSNTGGWSCAIAEFQGNWFVLAVPGDRAYLLEHLKNVSVT